MHGNCTVGTAVPWLFPFAPCHICPPTRVLMECTPSACSVSPNPIKLPFLLSSGNIGRFLWMFDGLLPLRFISFRSGYHVHAFFIRSSCFLCILFIACLVLLSTRYPAPIFLLTHLEDTKVWVQFCMGEPRARGQCWLVLLTRVN